MKNWGKYLLRAAVLALVMLGLIWLLGGRTYSSFADAQTAAPADQVFAFLIQPELRKEWIAGVEDITRLTDFDAAIGTQHQVRGRFVSGDDVYLEEVIEFEPNQLLQVQGESPTMTWTTTYALEPDGGGTRIHRRTQTQYHGLPRFLTLFTGDSWGRYLEGDLAALKQAVESP